MLVGNPIGAASLAHGDGQWRAVDHLHQRGVSADEIAAFADCRTDGKRLPCSIEAVGVGIDDLGLAIIDGFRKKRDRAEKRLLQLDARMR